MPVSARVYVSIVSAAGIGAIAYAFYNPPWSENPRRFAIYFLLSLLAATLKLRLPGVTGTMSVGFVFVLLGIAQLTLAETTVMAGSGVLLQCYWRAQARPAAVQILFSLSAVAVSLSVAAGGAEMVRMAGRGESLSIVMAVATLMYFVCNSLLVSGILSLVQRQSLHAIWQRCYLFAFPYYLMGGAIAGLMTASARDRGWPSSLLILPVMGLIFLIYRIFGGRMVAAPQKP